MHVHRLGGVTPPGLPHLKLLPSQCSAPSPPGSSSGNLGLNPASETSSLISDSGQKFSLLFQSSLRLLLKMRCFSTMLYNPFGLGHTCKFSEPSPSAYRGWREIERGSAGSRRACWVLFPSICLPRVLSNKHLKWKKRPVTCLQEEQGSRHPGRQMEPSWLYKTRGRHSPWASSEEGGWSGESQGCGERHQQRPGSSFPLSFSGEAPETVPTGEIPSAECHTSFPVLLILMTSFAFFYLFQSLLLSASFYRMKAGMQWRHSKPAIWTLRKPRAVPALPAPSTRHRGTYLKQASTVVQDSSGCPSFFFFF